MRTDGLGGDRHRGRPRLAQRLGLAVLSAAVLWLVLAPLALAITLPPAEAGRSVYDLAEIWRGDTIASAEQTADRLRSQTGVEMAILSIPTGATAVGTDTAAADARTVMDTWGVGQKGVNNGIVVLFDLDTTLRHGQIYIYGGSGILSTYLSQAAIQSIADDMLANAKAGDLDAALVAGMREIADAVDHPGSRLAPGSSAPPRNWTTGLTVLDILLAVLAALLGLFAGR